MTDTYKFIEIVNCPPIDEGDVVLSELSRSIADTAIPRLAYENPVGQDMLKSLGRSVGREVRASAEPNTHPMLSSHLIGEIEEMSQGEFPREFSLGLYSVLKELQEGVTV